MYNGTFWSNDYVPIVTCKIFLKTDDIRYFNHYLKIIPLFIDQIFPNYMKKIADSGGTPTYSRPCCVAEISSKKNNDLTNDIKNILLNFF